MDVFVRWRVNPLDASNSLFMNAAPALAENTGQA